MLRWDHGGVVWALNPNDCVVIRRQHKDRQRHRRRTPRGARGRDLRKATERQGLSAPTGS